MENPTPYYVYIFTDPIDQIPFYVGKGKANRFSMHEREYKSNLEYWKVSEQPACLKDLIFFDLEARGLKYQTHLVENLSEIDAFILEQAFIAWFGRKIYGNGVLTNKISGGQEGALFFDEQALLEVYRRPDLLSQIIKWPKYSKPWPARVLYFYQANKEGFPFTKETIDNLYLKYSYEELGAKTAKLLHEYDSVITPLYWVRKVNQKKKVGDDSVYIMTEGLEMIKPFYFFNICSVNFEKYLKAYAELKNCA